MQQKRGFACFLKLKNLSAVSYVAWQAVRLSYSSFCLDAKKPVLDAVF